jgi:hypothetical protein
VNVTAGKVKNKSKAQTRETSRLDRRKDKGPRSWERGPSGRVSTLGAGRTVHTPSGLVFTRKPRVR